MITCPRCGTVNGVRRKNPVKCTRCWYVFEKWSGEIELSGRGVEGHARENQSSKREQGSNVDRLSEQVSSPAAPTKASGPLAQMGERQTKDVGGHSTRSLEVAGSIPARSTMQSLRDICAGRIPKQVHEPEEEEDPEAEVLYCRIAECGKAMVQAKGWWVCPDVGCPMGGIQQKRVV